MTAEELSSAGAQSLGATLTSAGVSFAVFSETAETIVVCLFDENDQEVGRVPLTRTGGHVHTAFAAGIGAGTRYGLRADGAYDPARALWFDPQKLLVDPYATVLDRPFVLRPELRLPRADAVDTASFVPKAIIQPVATEEPLAARRKTPGLMYELNVRGYTIQHPAIEPSLRGTLAALTQPAIVEHLQRIGVDAVELMPVTAFIDDLHLPTLGLHNAWGYNPVSYFALDPRLAPGGLAELRAMTDAYRKAGISVILDVVYNHTGESEAGGPILSFRGLDARTYYRHVESNGRLTLVNDAGTGNTLRTDHPVVQQLVIDSLRHWVERGGVSGFRFDLATILGRDPGFNPEAVMLQRIKADPVLSKCILVAEPWDPGPGGYGLGQFGREFREWNDTYRDQVREFWRGGPGKVGSLAAKLAGSSEIFGFLGRKPNSGVNLLAAHDGFTLRDLVTYAEKHNEANGENNRDGHAHNASWNCGVEGPTDDERVNTLRWRDVRALFGTLFTSRGLTLLQQGDELGRTQQGNNNAYAQDNEITWLDWANADESLIEYVAAISAFRRAHPSLTQDRFLTGQERNGLRDVVWMHRSGREMTDADWNDPTQSVLGMHLMTKEDDVMVWYNRHAEAIEAKLPAGGWMLGFSPVPEDDLRLDDAKLILPPRSVVALFRAYVPNNTPGGQPTPEPAGVPPSGPSEVPPEPDYSPSQEPGGVPPSGPPETEPSGPVEAPEIQPAEVPQPGQG